ncbi:MAG: amino acid permease [Methanomicrobiaceae archaeon]|nr:amino acid permease [Methanomicrobiaceae archaeon]
MREQGPAQLKRVLTLREVVLSGIGVILGAGIYALIGEAAGLAGNAIWMAFILTAIIAAFTGLSYAELSSMFPLASAEYEYTSRSFGQSLAFLVGILVILSGIVGAATVSLGFAGYFTAITGIPMILTATILLFLLSIIIFTGIKQSAAVIITFTLIEAGGLIGIIAIGFPYLGSVDYLEMPMGIAGVLQASALIFFAYQGFEQIVKLSEETIEPERTIPQGLLLALAVTILLYILVALAAVSVAGWQTLAGSPAPFAVVAEEALGPGAFLVFTLIALFATANTALLMLLSSSRIMFGMARSRSLPQAIGYVHPRTRSPLVAIAVAFAGGVLFLSLGNIRDVALMANFTLFVTFAIINAAVILLRFRMPERSRPFRVPGAIGWVPLLPVLGIMTCLFFLFQMEVKILLIGGLIIILAHGAGFVLRRISHGSKAE